MLEILKFIKNRKNEPAYIHDEYEFNCKLKGLNSKFDINDPKIMFDLYLHGTFLADVIFDYLTGDNLKEFIKILFEIQPQDDEIFSYYKDVIKFDYPEHFDMLEKILILK